MGCVSLRESQSFPRSSIRITLTRVVSPNFEHIVRLIRTIVAHLTERNEALDTADVDESAGNLTTVRTIPSTSARLQPSSLARFLASASNIARRESTTSRPRFRVLRHRKRESLANDMREICTHAQVHVRCRRKRTQTVDVDFDAPF